MFCGECGTQNPDTNRFCINCGKPLKKNPNASPVAHPAPADAPVQPVVAQPTKPVSQQSYPIPPPGMTVPPAPATTTLSATQLEKSPRNWLAIVSVILALLSWVIYPIIIGFFAMGLGIFSLYTAKKQQSIIPVIAVIAIIIGLLAIVLNFFWMDIFPAPAILPPIR
jgi:amino acid transporter